MTDENNKPPRRFDHYYEPGAYAVCRRCGASYAEHAGAGAMRVYASAGVAWSDSQYLEYVRALGASTSERVRCLASRALPEENARIIANRVADEVSELEAQVLTSRASLLRIEACAERAAETDDDQGLSDAINDAVRMLKDEMVWLSPLGARQLLTRIVVDSPAGFACYMEMMKLVVEATRNAVANRIRNEQSGGRLVDYYDASGYVEGLPVDELLLSVATVMPPTAVPTAEAPRSSEPA